MKIFGKTDVGKVRKTNQDSFKIVKLDEPEVYICTVCDGMGGVGGGSTASKTAAETFTAKFALLANASDNNKQYENYLRMSVDAANSKVFDLSGSNAELTGMGTTLCAVVTDGKKIWAVSVGDSRIYMFKNREIIQISHDHSYVQALVDSGKITAEQSLSHPNKNIITRAVGTYEQVECDTFVMDFDMDGLLICSDGLTNFVGDNELNTDFLQYNNVEDLIDNYIEKANNNGGGDNITVLVLKKSKK